jgi:hypothetical protein
MRMRADGARLLCAQHAARQGPHNEEIEEASHHAGIVARLTHVFDGREDEMARLLGYILGKLPVLHLFCLHLSVTRACPPLYLLWLRRPFLSFVARYTTSCFECTFIRSAAQHSNGALSLLSR